MVFTYRCPDCISGSLTSTVNITSIEQDVKISGAFFDVSGVFQSPVLKQRVTTRCSNGHVTVNTLNKLPDEIANNVDYFTV
jgi:hypothetical protein